METTFKVVRSDGKSFHHLTLIVYRHGVNIATHTGSKGYIVEMMREYI